jgi:hypothetical protein
MLKRFLEMFFPGFSWEHGFALWDMGSAIGAGASILGGMMGDDDADDAADAQIAATMAAIDELKKIDKRTRRDNAPARGIGSAALYRLSDLLGLDKPHLQSLDQLADAVLPKYSSTEYDDNKTLYYNPYTGETNFSGGTGFLALPNAKTVKTEEIGGWDREKFKELVAKDYEFLKSQPTPQDFGSMLRKFSQADLDADLVYNKGLQFGLDEGAKQLNRRASALGSYDSGATLKALTRFANDYGETKAAGAYDRFTADKLNTYNMLMGTTNVGQNAIQTDSQTGSNIAQAVAGAQMGAGNARAAGIVGGANAWGNALSGIGNAYNQYQTNQTLKTIFNPNA